jgi:hypothetical protein
VSVQTWLSRLEERSCHLQELSTLNEQFNRALDLGRAGAVDRALEMLRGIDRKIESVLFERGAVVGSPTAGSPSGPLPEWLASRLVRLRVRAWVLGARLHLKGRDLRRARETLDLALSLGLERLPGRSLVIPVLELARLMRLSLLLSPAYWWQEVLALAVAVGGRLRRALAR